MERSLAEVARALATGTMSRRQALAWIGATLAGAVLGRPGAASAAPKPDKPSAGLPVQHGAPLRGMDIVKKGRSLEGRFGLMFKKLPAFEPPDELLIGLASRSRMEETSDTPENSSLPAGFVFLGQFIDHDLTFDNTPIPAQQKDPHAVTNFRAASLDLDSVYGAGPSQEKPDFYDPKDSAKLNIARNTYKEGDTTYEVDDLPRGSDKKAIIGDPRDDENLVTSQLHLAFRKFHNALVDHVRKQGLSRTDEVFAEAQRLCRWHYQWMVVHDFLPEIVRQSVVDELLQERPGGPAKVKLDFYKPKNPNKPMMPIEFAVAAYRFGHSMLRRGYVINEQGESAILFGKTAYDFPENEGFIGNLNGGRPLTKKLEIAWRHFFEIPGADGSVNYARKIDGFLSRPLFTLPFVNPEEDPPVSLAERNLLRGKRLGLASGQRIAQEMGAEVLSNERLGLGEVPGWESQTEAPLWFYILKEAELQQEERDKLGEVGGRIVAEVFLGLLERDANSYLRRDPSFRPLPELARENDGEFGIVELLKFARVVD
jgi:hypothetical protein